MPQSRTDTLALGLLVSAVLGGCFILIVCWSFYGKALLSEDKMMGFRVLEKHWVPHPSGPPCGTLYCLLEGDSSELASAVAAGRGPVLTRLVQPIDDVRFVHTLPSLAWWAPSLTPAESYCRATIDHPSRSLGQQSEAEYVVSAVGNRIYYERRTLPLFSQTHDPNSAPALSVPARALNNAKKQKFDRVGELED